MQAPAGRVDTTVTGPLAQAPIRSQPPGRCMRQQLPPQASRRIGIKAPAAHLPESQASQRRRPRILTVCRRPPVRERARPCGPSWSARLTQGAGPGDDERALVCEPMRDIAGGGRQQSRCTISRVSPSMVSVASAPLTRGRWGGTCPISRSKTTGQPEAPEGVEDSFTLSQLRIVRSVRPTDEDRPCVVEQPASRRPCRLRQMVAASSSDASRYTISPSSACCRPNAATSPYGVPARLLTVSMQPPRRRPVT